MMVMVIEKVDGGYDDDGNKNGDDEGDDVDNGCDILEIIVGS